MFWTRHGKLIIDDFRQIIDCDNCPCPAYIIITKCDKQEDGFDDCTCDLEAAGRRAFVVPYKCGKIFVYDHWWKLNIEYNKNHHPNFSQWGSVFRALEPDITYCLQAKAQEKLDSEGFAFWGQKVISACKCCCLLPFSARIEFNFLHRDYFLNYNGVGEIVTNSSEGNIVVDVEPSSKSFQISVDDYTLTATYGTEPGKINATCKNTGPDSRKRITFEFRINDDCTELELYEITSAEAAANGPENCSFGQYIWNYFQQAEVTGCRKSVPLTAPYPEGYWEMNCSVDEIGEAGQQFGNSFSGSLRLTKIDTSPAVQPASSYYSAYNKLCDDLK